MQQGIYGKEHLIGQFVGAPADGETSGHSIRQECASPSAQARKVAEVLARPAMHLPPLDRSVLTVAAPS